MNVANRIKGGNFNENSAIAILIGAGVKVNKKSRKMTWTLGNKFGKNVVEAGSYLDRLYLDEDKGRQWQTEYINPNFIPAVRVIDTQVAKTN